MIKTVKILFLSFFVISVFAEAGIKFTYTWKNPEAESLSFAGKKVAVVVLSTNRAGRRAAEEALAREITKRGAEGIAASAIVTESEIKDRELAKTKFREQSIAGALVVRATPEGGGTVDPDMWKNPIYKDVWGFTSRSWSQEDAKPENVRFTVEMTVYSFEQDRTVWIGTTEMKSTKLSEFISGVVDEIAEEMAKVDLLKPKQ